MEIKSEEFNENEFSYGLKGHPPTMLMMAFPIKAYALQGAEGLDMFYGKMRRMEAVGVSLIKEEFVRQKQGGIITPKNGPTNGSSPLEVV